SGGGATKAWYQSTGFLSTIAGVVLIATAAVLAYQQGWLNGEESNGGKESIAIANEGDQAEEVQGETVDFADAEQGKSGVINPPFGELIKGEWFTVDAEKGGTYHVLNSTITVPANAFVDQEGNAITGEVQMNLKEYHDAIDVVISGIPMTWEEDGEVLQFETGGMIDVRGEQDGRSVEVAENKSMIIKMTTDVPTASDSFNEYYFNETSGLWEERGKMNRTQKNEPVFERDSKGLDNVSYASSNFAETEVVSLDKESEENEALASVEKRIVKHKKTKPNEPRTLKNTMQQITLEFSNSDFPELEGYSGVLWEVDPSKFDKSKAEVEWTEVQVKKGLTTEDYILTFIRPGDRYSVQCYPVVSEQDKSKASAIFQEKLSNYNKKLDQLEEEKRQLEEERRRQQLLRAKELQEARARANEARLQQRETSRTINLMVNAFSVNRMGIYNCDTPSRMP
ncbi:MAG: hypothetical protein AAF193_09075, partial [Bacteroidota bacterium]